MEGRKRYGNVVEMIRDVSSDPAQAESLADNVARKMLAHYLFGLRSNKGVSQTEMARRLECTQSRVSKLENSEDDDLRLGDLRDYLRALDHDLMFVVCKRRWTLVEQIKFYACMIRSCLSRLVGLAKNDPAISAGVSQVHVTTLFNMIKLVAESAKGLPNLAPSMPSVIEADDQDECSNADHSISFDEADAALT